MIRRTVFVHRLGSGYEARAVARPASVYGYRTAWHFGGDEVEAVQRALAEIRREAPSLWPDGARYEHKRAEEVGV